MSIPDLKLEITANAVAWYGAIVASLGFVFGLYNILRDRARVKIEYGPDRKVIGTGIYDENKDYLCIKVINKGRRPIKIDQALLVELGNDKNLILADSFSDKRIKVLSEECPSTTFMAQQDLFDLKKILYVQIEDGTGRKHKKYVKRFPTFWMVCYFFKKIFNKNEDDKS